MPTLSNANLGPFIAYLVPGATALWGMSRFSPALQSWFTMTRSDAPTIGGFLYLTIASLAVGMTVSAIRWAIVDRLHAWTGLAMPRLDFSKLGKNVEAFRLLIEIHYGHYLHYGNMAVALAITYLCYRVRLDAVLVNWIDLGFLVVEVILLATSRDTLRRYYTRTELLLGPPPERTLSRHELGHGHA